MNRAVLVDTGPLVAMLVEGEEHHLWTVEQIKETQPPLFTCEPVLTEAAFLLRREGFNPDALLSLVQEASLKIAVAVETEVADIRFLMNRFRGVPMSLADACLVRLSELHPNSRVMTFDRDFKIYRKNGNRVIPLLMPPGV